MLQKRKGNVFHRLYIRVYLYFLCVVVVFAILMGLIFSRLYEANTMSSYYNLLSSQADVIAERMKRYVISNDIEDYSVYLEMLEDSMSSDIWIFSNPNAAKPMSEELINIQLTEEEMSAETKRVLEQAYDGKVSSQTGYSIIHEMKTMTVGAPIYNQNDEVVGAVLVISAVETQQEIMNNIIFLFLVSIMVASAIALMLAIIFTRKLSRPIMKIRSAAIQLSEGSYSIRLPLNEHNEIGELAATVDILAKKLQENEIQREYMEQMRNDFFSNVSHELRTPITVVRAYLESLVDGVVSEDKIPGYYERMLNECSGMQRLIQDLLLLSKMENPDFHVEKEPVNINQVFEDIIRSVRVVCMKKNLSINMESDKEYCFINGDYDRIRQVFLAILDNAIKFSHFDSSIYIKIDSKEKIIIQITDLGIGMVQEELEHVFDKFYTKKTLRNKNGSGLGLVIAKSIVEKHNGVIYVESEKDKGTTFTIELDQIYLEQDFDC